MLNSTKSSARDNSRLVIALISQIRQQANWQLKDARIIIAPESNTSGYAEGIFRDMCSAKVPEFIMLDVDKGGEMPGIRTNELNKMQMAEAFGFMTDQRQIRVWDKFETCGKDNGKGDSSVWMEFVDEMSTFMEITETSEEGKTRTKLTGKKFGGQDDLVMCALLYTALSKYFITNMKLFTAKNNPHNKTSLQTEERTYDQMAMMMRHMKDTSFIPVHSLLWHNSSVEANA